MADIDEVPWTTLPPETAAALRPQLPGLSDEIITAIGEGVPEYARPFEGPFGVALRAGVEQALARFVDLIADPEPGADVAPGREVYVQLGRGEMRQGRALDALLSAYRVGARVAWRRLAAAGEQAGIQPKTLYLLAESIFAYIDEISSASVEGYATEQAAAAGELQRQRRRLAALLTQASEADTAAVEAAAASAGWALPQTLAAIYAEGEDPDRLALRLGSDVIATQFGPGIVALLPDPDGPGRRAQLESALEGHPASLGPTVSWRRAATSAERARAVLDLAGEGEIAGTEGLVIAADHVLTLLLNADRGLARDMAHAVTAPLEGETPASRERLMETLRAWLEHQGRTEQAAEALHVHPQTVRYRMGRLRELFGDVLEDPEGRFELELGLRLAPAATPD